METVTIGHCWCCGVTLTSAEYGRETRCLGCGRSTRSCRNCRFYRPGRPNDCLEPMAEAVQNKLEANFCEHFDPALEPFAAESSQASDSARLLRQAEDLFK